jgi:hypothetical protein
MPFARRSTRWPFATRRAARNFPSPVNCEFVINIVTLRYVSSLDLLANVLLFRRGFALDRIRRQKRSCHRSRKVTDWFLSEACRRSSCGTSRPVEGRQNGYGSRPQFMTSTLSNDVADEVSELDAIIHRMQRSSGGPPLPRPPLAVSPRRLSHRPQQQDEGDDRRHWHQVPTEPRRPLLDVNADAPLAAAAPRLVPAPVDSNVRRALEFLEGWMARPDSTLLDNTDPQDQDGTTRTEDTLQRPLVVEDRSVALLCGRADAVLQRLRRTPASADGSFAPPPPQRRQLELEETLQSAALGVLLH